MLSVKTLTPRCCLSKLQSYPGIDTMPAVITIACNTSVIDESLYTMRQHQRATGIDLQEVPVRALVLESEALPTSVVHEAKRNVTLIVSEFVYPVDARLRNDDAKTGTKSIRRYGAKTGLKGGSMVIIEVQFKPRVPAFAVAVVVVSNPVKAGSWTNGKATEIHVIPGKGTGVIVLSSVIAISKAFDVCARQACSWVNLGKGGQTIATVILEGVTSVHLNE
jgi:hypothetical protein